MKNSFILGGTVLVATIMLSGCGNKGALYLPEPQQQLQPTEHPAPNAANKEA